MKMSMICPSLCPQLFTESSTSHTNSPFFKFRTCSFDHFDLSFHCGRYSRVNLSRSCRHMLEPFRNIFSGHVSVHWMTRMVHLCPSKIWFVVRAVRSSGSSLTAVRAFALSICSTRHIVVLSTSSLRLRLSKIKINTFLQI